MPPRRYTEEQFRTAVADPEVRTVADLCRALGLLPRGANYETVRAYGRGLDLDVDHELADRGPAAGPEPPEGPRSYTDADLSAALDDPSVDGFPALCARLDLVPHHTTHRRLEVHAERLGLPIPSGWSKPGPRAEAPRLYEAQALREAVADSLSLAAVIRRLGGRPSRTTYARVANSIHLHGIETSHFLPDGGASLRRRRPLEEVLVNRRLEHGTTLRRRLINEGLKEHRCEGCGLCTWADEPIPLELDHVDGDRANNTLRNLRLLCPNCHALTPTYRGRNIGRSRPS